jgi:hypothetical protein
VQSHLAHHPSTTYTSPHSDRQIPKKPETSLALRGTVPSEEQEKRRAGVDTAH